MDYFISRVGQGQQSRWLEDVRGSMSESRLTPLNVQRQDDISTKHVQAEQNFIIPLDRIALEFKTSLYQT